MITLKHILKVCILLQIFEITINLYSWFLETKAFECGICCMTYKQEWRLKNHYEQIHEVNLDDESNSTEAGS